MILENTEILEHIKGIKGVNIILSHAKNYGLKTEIINESHSIEIWVKDEIMDTTECYYVTDKFTTLNTYRGA
jgi:hypothetical protein